MRIKLLRLHFLFLMVFNHLSAEPVSPIDSLQQILQKPNLSDSLRAVVLNELAFAYHNRSPLKADSLAKEALEFAHLLITTQLTADSYFNMGIAQWALGNYAEALQRQFQALELYELSDNNRKIADTYNQIGITYADQKDNDKALEYLFKANELYKALDNKKDEALNDHHIGIVFYQKRDPNRALVYYREALNIRQEIEDQEGIAESLTNMGSIFYDQMQFEKALHYHQRALEIRKKMHNNVGIATNYRHLGYLYREKGDFDSAMYALTEGQKIADSLQNRKERLSLYKETLALLEELDSIKDAYLIQKKYIGLKDTLFNLERTEQLVRLQTEYQTLQRQEENDVLKEQNEISTVKLQNQSVAFIAILGLLFFSSMLGYISWKNAKRMRQANRTLSKQKEEIEQQHKIIDEQHTEIYKKTEHIESSIRYAKRIQTATLPKLADMNRILHDCFVFYKPRDIVSGDFYWFGEIKPKLLYENSESPTADKPVFKGMSNSKVVIAAVDCTGHGVPGAFMSMLGEQMLEKIVMEAQITEPGLILDMLQRSVRHTLRQEETNNRDGMDLGLCLLDKRAGKIEFAGAKSPLYFIKNGEITNLKGNKMSIGGRQDLKFTTHKIDIDTPTSFYLCSDGFKDQFGGPERRKFSPKKFKELLLEIHELPMNEQNKILNDTFMKWTNQAGEKQIDDVLVIGFKVNPPIA